MLIKLQENSADVLEKDPFVNERELENLINSRLDEIFPLKFLDKVMIDTYVPDGLAYDEEMKAIVVLEYKNKATHGLLEQGLAYHETISSDLEVQSEIVRKFGIEPDFSQTRVMFISPEFTQKQKSNLISLDRSQVPVEFWRVRRYVGGLLNLERLEPRRGKTKSPGRESRDILLYDKIKVSESQNAIYENVKEYLLSIADFTIRATTVYVRYELGKDWVFWIRFIQNHVHIGGAKYVDNLRKYIDVVPDLNENLSETHKETILHFLKTRNAA